MLKRKRILKALAIGCLLSVAVACTGKQRSVQPVFLGESTGPQGAKTIDPDHIIVRAEPGAEGPFQHPWTCAEDGMKGILQALHFQRKSTFTWKNPEHVLNGAEATVLARKAVEAFSGLGSDQMVQFRLASNRGETEGELFVKDDYLHIRILTIQGYPFRKRGTKTSSTQWKLNPQEDQGFFPSEAVLWNPKGATNWIVVKLADLQSTEIEDNDDSPRKPLMERLDVFP